MNRLGNDKRALILKCLCEGVGIRATSRLTGADKETVSKLLVEIGHWSEQFHALHMRELPCKLIQVDEAWAFCGCKERNATDEKRAKGQGDVWTSIAMCSDSKLAIAWHVGERDWKAAYSLMFTVRRAVIGTPQISTDAWHVYKGAIGAAFRGKAHYGQVVKRYGQDPNLSPNERRYSPSKCLGAELREVFGSPDPSHISTSHIERQNLTLRMSSRRFTRLTNAFSKKLENHGCAVALHFLNYNFVRPHASLKGLTPAQAIGAYPERLTLETVAAMSLETAKVAA